MTLQRSAHHQDCDLLATLVVLLLSITTACAGTRAFPSVASYTQSLYPLPHLLSIKVQDMATTDIEYPDRRSAVSSEPMSCNLSRNSLEVPSILRLYSGEVGSLDFILPGASPEKSPICSHPPTPSLSRQSSASLGAAWRQAAQLLRDSWQYKVTGRASAAAVLADLKTEHTQSGGQEGVTQFATDVLTRHKLDDTFYVYDLGNVVRMFKAWRAAMPRVTPHYAVKCNPEPAVLRLLAAMGAGFDCASKGELEAVLDLGVPQSRIIFAHPCKRSVDIKYAAEHHIQYTTFDTESELEKIAQGNPNFKCVLRIRADDPEARVPLGLKYGANPDECPYLLERAKDMGLQVVGVSFHVGSACKNLAAYADAIATARHIFDVAELMGFHMELLDIGGGFTGHFDSQGNVVFGEIAKTVNAAIAAEFPAHTGVRIIAEPGRYFAETSATIFTPVYGKRDRPAENGKTHKDYWITDGLYGSFNCIIYDGQSPAYDILRSPLLPEPAVVEEFESTIWGPTCDSADCVYKNVNIPEMRVGDWLVWRNAGAYTVAGACDFNGINMTQPSKFYIFSEHAVDGVDGENTFEEEDEGEEE